ncbi:sugar phosphate isomerase/epimerase [Litorilinea aerophila]|nr:sugar phosphate isomerase/epimerase family protein [Litorilinea aerophila]MCC9078230.1 sugar phosphate isomerase/epimerase [Litorilinea aerophila]
MQLGAMNDPRRNLLEEIRWIGEQGFDFVELTFQAPTAAVESQDWSTVGRAIADAGLQVLAHAAPYLPVENPSPLVRQAALDELRRTIDAAQRVGARLCTVGFRGWPAYMSEATGYEYCRQLFSILVRHGAEQGVQVALENSPQNRHQLKYFREIFSRVPDLGLTYDIGHGNVETARSMTRDYLFALADRLRHVHLSDNDGSADDHLPVGAPRAGGIHLERELQHLRSFRYDGTITLQIFGDRRWLLASVAQVREAWAAAE